MVKNDELQIYRGRDYIINDSIIIKQPTLGEICELGEFEYFSMILTMTATPTDLMSEYDDINIRYEDVQEFELFCDICKDLTLSQTSIIFGNLDFSKLKKGINNLNDESILYDEKQNVIIDRYTYMLITDYLRSVHGFKKHIEYAADEFTREVLIDEARGKRRKNKNKKEKSVLKSMISSMINTDGFNYNHDTVWDVKINAFMDDVSRSQIIINYKNIMTGAYTGNIDLKKIAKKELNWMREIE